MEHEVISCPAPGAQHHKENWSKPMGKDLSLSIYLYNRLTAKGVYKTRWQQKEYLLKCSKGANKQEFQKVSEEKQLFASLKLWKPCKINALIQSNLLGSRFSLISKQQDSSLCLLGEVQHRCCYFWALLWEVAYIFLLLLTLFHLPARSSVTLPSILPSWGCTAQPGGAPFHSPQSARCQQCLGAGENPGRGAESKTDQKKKKTI